MGKENKKLESRDDILSCWAEKWGMIEWNVVKTTTEECDFNQNTSRLVNGMYEWTGDSRPEYYSKYEILYSPESNFFEVMFWKVRDGYHKKNCVDSLDPLQYLKDNLNDTTS